MKLYAATSLTGLTAYLAMFEIAKVNEGDFVVILGVAGATTNRTLPGKVSWV